jgi:UDP:flavonoid glycosyltransferase YjiC (YdhE family)
MRVWLSTYGSRGDVEPLVGLAVELRSLGAEVRVCAPPDFADLLAGAPQVVVPQAADQPYWAGRVAELGIGVAHDGPTPTSKSLSAALTTVLSAETRARATEVASTIRSDGATVAAKLLVDAISREGVSA